MKKPWLAAVLNFMLSGLGYLYLGKRKMFGALLLGGETLIAAWVFSSPMAAEVTKNIWVISFGFIWSAAFAMDAYNEACIGRDDRIRVGTQAPNNISQQQGSSKQSCECRRGTDIKKIMTVGILVLLIGLIVMGIISVSKTRDQALDIRQTILNKEDFRGQTKDQILKRFGKPRNFHNIGAISRDGRADTIEMLHYPALGIDMVVYLNNGIVTKVEYEQKQQQGYLVFTIDDVIVDSGQIQVSNPKYLSEK